MKVKHVLIALVIALCILIGCGKSNPTASKVVAGEPSMFVVIESNPTLECAVVYHRETKVMYAVSSGIYCHGNFTVLVNPDGTPMLYEGE